MRIVFTGAGPTAVMTARELIDAGLEVVALEVADQAVGFNHAAPVPPALVVVSVK